jgi:YesN/AraC family two-component response regulator
MFYSITIKLPKSKVQQYDMPAPISINDLSNSLNIPSSHLAYIFKCHCKLSFVEYKNYCKINDSLNLINNNFLESKTFDALAYKVGFKSYNSFFIYFKKQTNYSPKDYLLNKHRK